MEICVRWVFSLFAIFTMSAILGLLLSVVAGYACYFLQILRLTSRSESRLRRQAAREIGS